MGSYKEQYYALEEHEMQELIAKAKKENTNAQEELLKVFNNFLTKYVTMLFTGKYSFSDYDIRRFLSLFVKDPYVRFALMRNKLNQAGYKHVNECIGRNIIYGQKILHRTRRSTNGATYILSMCKKVRKKRFGKRTNTL